jgi:hypothetical protein
MRESRTLRLRGLIAFAMFAASSCVSGSGAAPSGRPLPDNIAPAGTGVVLSPPGQSVAVVASADAFKLCSTGVADCDSSTPNEIDLAIADDPNFGTAGADGSIKRRLDRTLVWAIVWRAIDCPRGGGALTGATRAPEQSGPPPHCDKIAIVDAKTGAFVYTLLYPSG